MKPIEAESITITVITDNYTDMLRRDERIARRPAVGKSPLDTALHAEHGLAYHVETTVAGRRHAFLFDFATDARGLEKNVDLLGIDLRAIEALALSHHHFDHEAALAGFLKARAGEIPRGIPLFVGKGFFAGSYLKKPDGEMVSLTALERTEMEGAAGVRIVEVDAPAEIVPGACLTGPIARTTEYEKIPTAFLARSGDGFVQEEFRSEQAVVMMARGKGLVVLSGCAHRGIVNTVKHAQKMTGEDKVHAVIGGFHLSGAEPGLIQRTVADLQALGPEHIVPTHCTGFEAVSAFARAMPERFLLNTAGTRYEI